MYCKNCGKEIKDGACYCPMCGKPTGIAKKEENGKGNFKKKKPNLKFIMGIIAVAVLVLLVGTIGKKLSSTNNAQSVADNEEIYDASQNNADDKKWANTKSYKTAYKEEYNSFEKMVQEYCEMLDIEYMETIDEYAEQIDKAYKSIEKAIPGLSDKIAKDISSNAESETGSAIVEKVASAAINNETVRKTAYKATMVVADSLFDYVMNYTTTDYPFGFDLLALNGDYALLRSAGTYEDMYKIIRRSMSYDIKLEAIQDRIEELENKAQEAEDKDEYAECMGRIAANRAREKEVKELFSKCMASVACGGNYYCSSDSIKLYWVVHKDGTIYNTFWAPAGIKAENWNFNITMNEEGSCFLDSPTERFVIDRTGKIIFEGNSFEERDNEAVGESIICTYSPSGNALRETKEKDSTYGTYYVMELVTKNGKSKKLLKMRDYSSPLSVYDYYWNEDSMVCSDYTLLQYTSLENQAEEVVIDLSSGKLYSREEFEKAAEENNLKEIEKNQTLVKSGTPNDDWQWDAESDNLFVTNHSITLGWFSGLSDAYYVLDTRDTKFNTETLLKNIGESREINHWYCKDNLLWVVTRSGYFYTYDLKKQEKNPEIEIGENSPYCFTPYGLVVYNENGHKDSSGKESEYSVYQYDAFGKKIGKYPAYSESISLLGNHVFDFIYCSGKDTYNLATQEVISLE